MACETQLDQWTSRPGLVLGPQGKEALFPSGLLNWQDVILELPGPSWLPGEESEANTEGSTKRAGVRESRWHCLSPWMQLCQKQTTFGLPSFMSQWIPYFVKATFSWVFLTGKHSGYSRRLSNLPKAWKLVSSRPGLEVSNLLHPDQHSVFGCSLISPLYPFSHLQNGTTPGLQDFWET